MLSNNHIDRYYYLHVDLPLAQVDIRKKLWSFDDDFQELFSLSLLYKIILFEFRFWMMKLRYFWLCMINNIVIAFFISWIVPFLL